MITYKPPVSMKRYRGLCLYMQRIKKTSYINLAASDFANYLSEIN